MDDLERCARALAEQQGIKWDDLPATNEDAAPRRSPDCCNRLDCKEDINDAVLAVLAAAGRA